MYNFVDGTTNFAHGYPSFAVSVGVLYRGNPAAATVVIYSWFIIFYFFFMLVALSVYRIYRKPKIV